MVSMNINLDESLKRYIDSEVAAGRYASADDLVADLVRDRQRASASDDSEERDTGDKDPELLRRLIQEGLDSGPPEPWTPEKLAAIKVRIEARIATQQRKRA